MTICCFDGKYLAADRQLTAGSFIIGYQKKIIKWSKGIYAMTGALKDDLAFVEWLETGKPFKPTKGMSAFFSNENGFWYVDHDLKPHEALTGFAIGDPAEVAEGLMRAGFSAEQTVKEMCKTNILCGGKVDVVEIVQ